VVDLKCHTSLSASADTNFSHCNFRASVQGWPECCGWKKISVGKVAPMLLLPSTVIVGTEWDAEITYTFRRLV
jgi:hypothetical protein